MNPIFIVGPPRSGTTLLAAMLSAHSGYACGPETQFFSKLHPHELAQAVYDPKWPSLAVKLLARLTLSGQQVLDLYDLTEEDVADFLGHQPPSIQAMLRSLTESFATRNDKPSWIEKTPNHLLCLPYIRELFPNARIIRIIRDPRDSALSICRLPWASDSFIANCYLLNQWYHKSHAFFAKDSLTLTLRYEDLTQDPTTHLHRVTNFMSVAFEPEMLNHQRSAHNVITDAEPWKRTVGNAISLNRRYVWRRELPFALAKSSSLVCHRLIRDFGYPEPIIPKNVFAATPFDRQTIEKLEPLIVNAAQENILIVRGDLTCSKHPILLTRPPVVGTGVAVRFKRGAALTWYLAKHRFIGQRASYFAPNFKGGKGSLLSTILIRMLASRFMIGSGPT